MIQRTHLFIASAAHVNRMKHEVKQLLPLIQQESTELKESHVSLASVILATAHNDMFYNEVSLHTPACPVKAKLIPLTTISETVSFKTNPCTTCVKTRLHHLASEIFCADFEEHCKEAIVNNGLSTKLRSELCKSYTTIDKFKEELFIFASSRFTPGRTWIVYDDKCDGVKNIKIINLSYNQVPLIYGIWPIGVINMTESVLCEAIVDKYIAKTADIIAEQPNWSHAARTNLSLCSKVKCNNNNNNNNTKLFDGDDIINNCNVTLCEQRENSLERARWTILNNAWQRMNWAFVESQLNKAVSYYYSKDREQTQKQFLNKEKRKCTERVLGTNMSTDLSLQNLRESDNDASVKNHTKVLSNEQSQRSNSHTNFDSTEKNDGEENEKCATTHKEKELNENNKTETRNVQESDPNRTVNANGIEQLKYKNGDIVYIYPDGKKMYVKEGLKTTVYTDRSTLHEYANNMKILERADGVRVTTFPDGRIHKEPYREYVNVINI